MMREVYWVGIETKSAPNGYGEDFRMYVTVKSEQDRDKVTQAAQRLIAGHRLGDGDRIAVHLVHKQEQ